MNNMRGGKKMLAFIFILLYIVQPSGTALSTLAYDCENENHEISIMANNVVEPCERNFSET